MKRWNIKHLLLYSHDGRRRQIDFDLEAVNIITGNSRTGKSAISEIIDYVMGSRDCHIPVRVRHYCAWVGLVWASGNTEVLMCRRVPLGKAKSMSEYQVEVGSEVRIPETTGELQRNMGLTEALKKFEQLLGMGDVRSETFSEQRVPERISLRHTVPFLLQDDTIIINKLHLLKGSDDDHRQSIIDRLPYFLGATDVTTVKQEAELRRLKAELASAERRRATQEQLRREADPHARALFLEAQGLDLLSANVQASDAVELRGLLADALTRVAERTAAGENDTFLELYTQRSELEERITELRQQVRAAQTMLDTSRQFEATSAAQGRRLQVVSLLPETSEGHACPVCSKPLDADAVAERAIRSAYDRVRRDLALVERERPKLDDRVQEWRDDIATLQRQVAGLTQQIESIVRSDDAVRQQVDLERRRAGVQRAIEFYLDLHRLDADREGEETTDGVKRRVEELEEELNRESKLAALLNMSARLNYIASDILRQLPFEELYRDAPVNFNPRDLTLGVIGTAQRLQMREIGADENYLSLHVATMLAFHRHFAQLGRPVPGVLLFDQLSRPYFPQDQSADMAAESGAAEEAVITEQGGPIGSNDRTHLKNYFDVLFDEVQRGESLQVIVLEHAYFADDPRFARATKQRWIGPEARLVPLDWPRHDQTEE